MNTEQLERRIAGDQAQSQIETPTKLPVVVPQPDSNGEFATPADGAIWMAVTYGVPQTPLRGKRPFLDAWQK